MVCDDFQSVLFACSWLPEFLQSSGIAGKDATRFKFLCDTQAHAFEEFADDLMEWFPESSEHFQSAAECCLRFTAVATKMREFGDDVCAWSAATDVSSEFGVKLRDPTRFWAFAPLMRLYEAKLAAERAATDTLHLKYEGAITMLFPKLTLSPEDPCLHCRGIVENCGCNWS